VVKLCKIAIKKIPVVSYFVSVKWTAAWHWFEKLQVRDCSCFKWHISTTFTKGWWRGGGLVSAVAADVIWRSQES